MKNTLYLSLLISLMATLGDQVYHTLLGIGHSILWDFSDSSTWIYVISKFIVVFLSSYLVLNHIKNSGIVAKSFIIGLFAAFAFSALLPIILPNHYDFWLHMAHFVVIGYGAWIVLMGEEKKWPLKTTVFYAFLFSLIISIAALIFMPSVASYY